MGQKFFISFNSADRTRAHWIAWTLKEAGQEVAVHDSETPAGGNEAVRFGLLPRFPLR
jgi:TIR domain